MKKLLLITAMTVLTFGCASTDSIESTKIAAASVYQSYNVNASRDGTIVKAQFRVGNSSGVTIDLDAPAKIEVNGVAPAENVNVMFAGTFYKINDANSSPQLEFAFTNNDGKIYRNSFYFEAVEFGVTEITLKRGVINKIPVTRIQKDSNVNFQINLIPAATNSQSNGEMISGESINSDFDEKTSSLVIQPDVLKKLKIGAARLEMNIYRGVLLTEKTAAGGRIDFNYRAAPVSVRIE